MDQGIRKGFYLLSRSEIHFMLNQNETDAHTDVPFAGDELRSVQKDGDLRKSLLMLLIAGRRRFGFPPPLAGETCDQARNDAVSLG